MFPIASLCDCHHSGPTPGPLALIRMMPPIGLDDAAMGNWPDDTIGLPGGSTANATYTTDAALVSAPASTISLIGSGFTTPGFSIVNITLVGSVDGVITNVAADDVTVVDDNTITFTVPVGLQNIPSDLTSYGFPLAAGAIVDVNLSTPPGHTVSKDFFLWLRRPPHDPYVNAFRPDKISPGMGAGFPFKLIEGASGWGGFQTASATFLGSAASVEFAADFHFQNMGRQYLTPSFAPTAPGLAITTENGTATTDQALSLDGTTRPLVYSVDPWHGPPSGGTAITIHGKGFLTDTITNVVMGDQRKATSVVVVDDNTITCVSPPLTAAQDGVFGGEYNTGSPQVDVVYATGPTDSVGGKDFFLYEDLQFSPDHGAASGGTVVTLTSPDADYFVAGDVPVVANFYGGGLPSPALLGVCTNAVVVDARTLTCTMPAMPKGGFTFRIMAEDGTIRGGAFGSAGTFLFT